MPVVAVTDYTFPTLEIEEAILQPLGVTLRAGQCKTEETLIPLVRDADAVITQFAPLTPTVIDAMQNAKVIVRYGIGVDNVSLRTARKRHIPVCNVPDYCIHEVADHTLAFILALTRQVLPNAELIRHGNWGLATPLTQMRTLREMTVGIVGYGKIGRQVAARLGAFGASRLVCDPFLDLEQAHQAGCQGRSLERLLAESDIVTLHCPSSEENRHLLNSDTLAKLKPGAIVINLSRGDLIDTPALVAALQSGHVSAAALDVCDPEPIPLDSPLRSLPNVIASSHIASASPAAVRRLRETVANIAAAALRGEDLPNRVRGIN